MLVPRRIKVAVIIVCIGCHIGLGGPSVAWVGSCFSGRRTTVAIVRSFRDDVHNGNERSVPDVVAEEEKSLSYSSLPRLYVGPMSFQGQRFDTSERSKSYQVRRRGDLVLLRPDQTRYLTKVLRLRPSFLDGSENSTAFPQVRVFDGESGEWLGEIGYINSTTSLQENRDRRTGRRRQGQAENALYVRYQQLVRNQSQCLTYSSVLLGRANKFVKPWIVFAPIKKNRMKVVAEKCTELGVGSFIPVITERTEKANIMAFSSRDGLDKMNVYIVEAAEQCERLTIPSVATDICDKLSTSKNTIERVQLCNIRELLEYWKGVPRRLYVCRERFTSSKSLPILSALSNYSENVTSDFPVAFLIGPEGGWSPQEETLFDNAEQYPFISSISLGDLVLRAETAAIVAMGSWLMWRNSENGLDC